MNRIFKETAHVEIGQPIMHQESGTPFLLELSIFHPLDYQVLFIRI